VQSKLSGLYRDATSNRTTTMTTPDLRSAFFCSLGAVALSIVLGDGTMGAAAGEVGKAFETIPANETAEIEKLSELTVRLQDKRAEHDPSQEGMVLRGVHPKSHGCVRADFKVDEDLDPGYRVGLFATPGRTFEAWIRYSNAAVLREDDLKAADPAKPDERKNGSRGMALKVLDVEGEMLSEDEGRANQDFLMINTPEFAFADVREYVRLNRVLDLSEKGDMVDPFFLPLKLAGLLPLDPKDGCKKPHKDLEAADRQIMARFDDIFEDFDDIDLANTCRTLEVITHEIETRTVRDPLEVQYFGAAPFAFGPERAMKFSAAPCEEREQAPFENAVAGDPSPDYLREALTETIKGEDDVCFDFMILVRSADELKEDPGLEHHVENATTTWPDEESSYEHVARITIPAPQDPQAADVVAQCEALAFTPWHSLAAHRPLGGINRLRQQVYIESFSHRKAQGYR
jgi:hypothetical protein